MALAGMTVAADPITLETQLVTPDATYGLYSQWEEVKSNTALVENTATTWPSSLTFYVKVGDLLGANSLASTGTYKFSSFSWLGQASGHCTAGDDTLTISVGGKSITGAVQESSDCYTTALFSADAPNTLTFSTSDILTITLTAGPNDADYGETVEIMYMDTPGTNKLLGSASNLNADGTMNYWHEDRANGDNAWQKGWKTDAPVISMTLTQVPEPATATLSLLALAGLAARRRRK